MHCVMCNEPLPKKDIIKGENLCVQCWRQNAIETNGPTRARDEAGY